MRCRIRTLCWLLAFAPLAALAQEEAVDDTQAAEIDALEPAVSGPALDAVDDPPEPTTMAAEDVPTPSAGVVMDELELGRTEITGNQELPKVLYIVPWKKSAPAELMGRPVNTLLDEVLEPIDRSEFIRQVDYYSDLNPQPE